MELYSSNDSYKLYKGDMTNMLDVIQKESIDVVLTDPPYELNFMSKGWDNAGISFNKITWEKCFNVLKPGGYLLAFGGSRTFHRIACAIEDAGFEIRDTIMWLYGSGFPKSMNIGLAIDKKNGVESKVVGTGKSGAKETHTNSLNLVKNPFGGEYEIKEAQNKWQGWGTALKPSFEPIIVARKPFKGSLIDNVLKNRVGGINIDECRVGDEVISYFPTNLEEAHGNKFGNGSYMPKDTTKPLITHNGRFPANTILTYDETDFEEVCGGFPNTKSTGGKRNDEKTTSNMNIPFANHKSGEHYVDSGSASRYFYCAKASKRDRDEGCEDLEDTYNACSNQAIAEQKRGNNNFADKNNSTFNKVYVGKNTHPTVKPTSLMQYLVRLVTPKGGIILDPFMGSGSTGKAVMFENKDRDANYSFIGIEKEKEYCDIARARIEWARNYEDEKQDKDQIRITENGELI